MVRGAEYVHWGMAERVRITEVGPRDGLQNEPGVIPTAEKARLVELCALSGVDEVEVTSFVSPKWVPQLRDAGEMISRVCRMEVESFGGAAPCVFSVLVPNEQGLAALGRAESEAAVYEIEVYGPPVIRKISIFASASESFSRRNINASIDESFDRFRRLLGDSERSATDVRGYISCAIACPFEGPIAPAMVADVAARFVDLGVSEIDVADTIGAGTPESAARMLEAVFDRIGNGWLERRALTLHLHDTFGRAADCVKAALDLGVRSFDASVAGLGGCPYASTPGKRAPGNIATETLVRTLHEAGYETGVDLDKLAEAAAYAREIVGKARAEAAAAGGRHE